MGLDFDNSNRENAKDFLQLIIAPCVEETGFLDDIKHWKTNNQISVISKAQQIVKDRGANLRKVPLKVLSDLLEQVGLEEDEGLQKKWAALMANTVIENSKIDNTLYSHLLGQLSKYDAEMLDFIYRTSTDKMTDVGEQHKISITVQRNVFIGPDDLRKMFKEAHNSIDNLVRLRLIKEVVNMSIDSPLIMLSDLGFRFISMIS